MKLTGAQIVMESLVEQGVDTVFGYPGGAVLNLYDELYLNRHRITHYITCHEQGAAHAADGYARATGKTGVVLATSGPGATNLVTGIATAYLDSTPMVAITGNVATPLIGRDSFQEVDISGVTMPVTKHNYIVKDVEHLAETLREAFYIAQEGRPGPVLVDIPKDVQTAACEYAGKGETVPALLLSPERDALAQAAQLIAQAERPYLYAGGGVVISDASRELSDLADRIDAPVGLSMMGLTALPYDHSRALGMVGMHGRFAASKALYESDLIIAVGVRFSDRATGNKEEFSAGRRILHLDIDPAEIGKNIAAYTGLVGDIKVLLRSLLEILPQKAHPQWHGRVQELASHPDNRLEMAGDGLTPQAAIMAVRNRMPDDGIVATDVGQHQMWVTQFYNFTAPRTLMTSGGLGTMGFGMGAAIGACIGSGRKRTVLFTSDGSFHMNLNEMATAVTNGLPLIVVVLNNNALGMVRQWQTFFFQQRYSQTTLDRKTDFPALARAFGARAARAGSLEELERALEQAFSLFTPFLINCTIDPDEKVFPMIPPGGGIKNIILK